MSLEINSTSELREPLSIPHVAVVVTCGNPVGLHIIGNVDAGADSHQPWTNAAFKGSYAGR
jgi:hypothetical protein